MTINYADEENPATSEVILKYTQKSSAMSGIEFTLSGDGNYITTVSYDIKPEA